ncbi:MAG TPA: prepilin-type N-terminal cleavage/methylation domain-containing protein [Candidatus Paceibacterota bacterium]|nr:prepilin-type N-terminal cleavage/methylation domain-containing protein [Candidatus Paceibacterota bacterium]
MKKNPKLQTSSGFTLVEMLVVIAIIGLIGGILINNLRGSNGSRMAVDRAATGLVADLRKAQNLAIAGKTANGMPVCGFGVHYASVTTYQIYAGDVPNPSTDQCASFSRDYIPGEGDRIVETLKLIESEVEIKSWSGAGTAYDLFFESPDPITYINNAKNAATPLVITLGFKSAVCPTNCRTINIYSSGRIDLP